MTWLVDRVEDAAPGDRIAALWRRREILRMPGAHHPLAGVLAKRAGFEALYVSGGALSSMLALPDLGMITVEELCFFTRRLYRATGLPILVDADTGHGEALNVMRTTRELEDAGAAAMQIEDQILPKKCGHLSDKKLASVDDMVAKIAAAKHARKTLRIVARTDAVAQEGVEAAIERAKRYVAAGADAIFPEALTSEEMFRRFGQAIDVPLLANMTEFGRTPQFSADEFENFGFKMVIWPASALRASAKVMEELYGTIARDGSAEAFLPRMQTRSDLYETIRYHAYEDLDQSISKSVVPEIR